MEAFRGGKSASSLAKAYGCSPNTVSRTVKALLTTDEYNAIKRSRSKGKSFSDSFSNDVLVAEKERTSPEPLLDNHLESKADRCLTRSFGENQENLFDSSSSGLDDEYTEAIIQEENPSDINLDSLINDFHEIAPLVANFEEIDNRNIICKPLQENILPEAVYIVVDRSVELDIRQLKDFPEFGILSDEDQNRLVLRLFPNQRSAKRNCGRNQRVIKIPDSNLLRITIPFLLEKGISRLILESTLISLGE